MSFIKISDIYACIHKTLREDLEIRSLLGFDETTTRAQEALRIQKRMNPMDLVVENLPLITFYKFPGQREQNHLVYRFPVFFEIFTNDDVETALNIADRIAFLFDGKYLNVDGISSFMGEYVTSSEQKSDIENVYRYFVNILFSVGIK